MPAQGEPHSLAASRPPTLGKQSWGAPPLSQTCRAQQGRVRAGPKLGSRAQAAYPGGQEGTRPGQAGSPAEARERGEGPRAGTGQGAETDGHGVGRARRAPGSQPPTRPEPSQALSTGVRSPTPA